ncbi:MAG: hypothetical protein FJZ90_00635 [Chloroflexi bacterium]|nr:hypothetical protein [Chloroflexota bacterium]
MTDRRGTGLLSGGQIMIVLSFTLALFFVVAFVTKSVEAYRLRRWSQGLERDIVQMQREIKELEASRLRHQSDAWADEALRAAGWVPRGVISVRPIPVTPQTQAPPTPIPAQRLDERVLQTAMLFDNPNWEAWKRLILGFDRAREPYYNGER